MKTNYTNLDFLRSLAVLSVVAMHLYHLGAADFLFRFDPRVDRILHNLSLTGVMFFFVHTCLVLMLSMHRIPAAQRARNFLIRRAFRIYPLCWATILLALSTGLSDVSSAKLHALGLRGIVVNMLLAQNMLRGYASAVGPLWSLPWEAQMYLLLPLFFVLLKRFERIYIVFLLWAGALLLAFLATQPELPRMFHAAIFPPMFIAGMVAYKLLTRERNNRPPALSAWSWPFFILGLFALEGILVGTHEFESSWSAVVNAGICLTLAVAIPRFVELRARWIVTPAHQIAKYSYGIYLLHIPALVFVLRYLPRLPLALKLATFLVLTALLAFISFHVIEDPLIRLGKRLTQKIPAKSTSPVAGPCEGTSKTVPAAAALDCLALRNSEAAERYNQPHGSADAIGEYGSGIRVR